MSSESRLGVFTGLGAYVMWGFLPIYFKLVGHVAATDILAHRIAWSLPTGLLLIVIANRWGELFALLKSRKALWLLLSSVLIAGNWLLYIWAVGAERVMEASLGYFINPLVNVAIGAIFLSERLRRLQWVAVAFACAGVAVETYELGRLPWVALILCATFASYAVIRKQVPIDSRVGFTMEVLLLFPIAVIWLFVGVQQGRAVFGDGPGDFGLLMLAGPLTAFPLILFALSARRLRFSTIGIMQYVGPSLQFGVALAYGEALTPVRLATFALIWIGVILFSIDAYTHDQKMRRPVRQA